MYNTDLPTRAELPSAGQLLRSTALAALVAGGLLVTTVLPAEYGIDPTGIGRAMGLTQMGEIKLALASEVQAGKPGAVAEPQPTASIAKAAAPEASSGQDHGHDHTGASAHDHLHAPAAAPAEPAQPPASAEDLAPTREHTVTIRLKPGEAAEIKLSMLKDATVSYEWSALGGRVNYDTHGDPLKAPKGFYHGYGKGRNETAQAGELRAAFDGKHGWFWRNRSGADVTVTLKTRGDYGQIERVL